MMKLVNVCEKDLHIFRTTEGISMKFSGKMGFMIILKAPKTMALTLSRKHSFRKTTRAVKYDTTSLFSFR